MTILDRPPTGWKRPAIAKATVAQVLLNQGGRCKATGAKFMKASEIAYDHRPAVWERRFDTEANDTVPPFNDPDHIEAITLEEHRRRTFGTKATTAGSDLHRKAKGERLENNRAPPAVGQKPEREPKAPKGRRIPSRPFPGSKEADLRKRMDGTVERRDA